MNLVNGFIASMLFIRPTMKRCTALLHLSSLDMLKGIGNMPLHAHVVQLHARISKVARSSGSVMRGA